MSESAETESFTLNFDLHHPPAKVWRALTEPALLAQWLMDTDLVAPKVGEAFTFKTTPSAWWDGIVNCEVLELEVPKRLQYTWKGRPATSPLDTVVTWTLTPTDSGTRLTLLHSGFVRKNKFAFEGASKGWVEKVDQKLVNVLGGMDA